MMGTKQVMVLGALSLLLGTAFAGGAVGGAADAVTFKRSSQGVNLNQIIAQASPPAQGVGGITAMFQALAGKTVQGMCWTSGLTGSGLYSYSSNWSGVFTIVGASDGKSARLTLESSNSGMNENGFYYLPSTRSAKTLTPLDNMADWGAPVGIEESVKCASQKLTYEQVQAGMTTFPGW